MIDKQRFETCTTAMSVEKSELWRERLVLPAYGVGEAASYARISPSTVSAWHKRSSEKRKLIAAKKARARLSFLQLIELAVVAEMRRLGVKLPEIARARSYLEKTTSSKYPFAQLKFKTDGADILQDLEGRDGAIVEEALIAANHNGQLVWREMLSERLKQFNYDESGSVIQWKVAGENKPIIIDPRLAFGSPQVSGVTTSILKSRYAAGEEVDEIADDYSIGEGDVVEALLFEGIDKGEARLSKWVN